MSKLLFWVGVILVALVVMRILARQSAARQRQSARPSPRKAQKRYETMVQCAHCGVHLPAKEALHSQGKIWCSQEHARLGPAR